MTSALQRAGICPHCGKSYELPEDDPKTCYCLLTPPMEHTAIYRADPVEATVPNAGLAAFLPAARRVSGKEVHLHFIIKRRWHLYHMIEGFRWQADACQQLLGAYDKETETEQERERNNHGKQEEKRQRQRRRQ